MKVKELIKQLKKMPQDLDVGVGHHDNAEFEVAAWINSVYSYNKEDLREEMDMVVTNSYDKQAFEDLPDKWVCLHC